MTTEEAITIAIAAAIGEQAEPHRQRFDKLQRSTAAAEHSADVTDLAKRWGELGGTISDMSKRCDKLAADVEFLKLSFETHPNQRIH